MRCWVDKLYISRGFSSTHKGVDDSWNEESEKHQPIYSVDDGVVIYNRKQLKGGYVIKIKHTNGLTSTYGHLQKDSQKVHEGDKVKKGQQIANMGNSGLACTGCHCHFALQKDKVYLDPLKYINVYSDQYVGEGTKKRYKILYTKKAKGIPNEPLLVHNKPDYKATTVVKGMGINNGDEVETYGVVNNGQSILNVVDNVRHYYCSNKYLKDRT